MNNSTRFAPAKFHDPVGLQTTQQPQHPQHPQHRQHQHHHQHHHHQLSLPVEHASPNPRLPNVDPPPRTIQATHHSSLLVADNPFSSEHERAIKRSPQSSHHGILGPLQNPRMIVSHPGIVSDISPVEGAMLMPQGQRLSVSSVGTQSLGHGYESLGASDAWSPTSARNQGPNHADEQFQKPTPDHVGGKNDNSEQSSKIVEDEPPSWSELKTKAGKERKRLPLACIACRRKKTRCSGEKPACKHCLRSRVSCIYKTAARKAAPRTDYMALLDKRLKRMEERVMTIMPEENVFGGSRPGRAVVRPALPVLSSNPSPKKKRTTDQAFTGEVQDPARSRLQPVPDEPTRSTNLKDGEKTLLTEGAEFLPAKELQEHLAEVFFNCIYGQCCSFLHKPSFMRNLDADSVPPVLVLAVCAISARFSTHPLVDTEPAFLRGERWATPAREIAERRHGEPSLTILSVTAILSVHFFGTCEVGLSWSFSGQAMRMALALRLHELDRDRDRDPSGSETHEESELSFTDREIRRRTMWNVFLIDRFTAAGAETPPLGIEQDLRIQLPVKESHFQMEIPAPTEDLEGNVPTSTALDSSPATNPKDNMGVAAYVIRAVVLWGRLTNYLKRGGMDKDCHPIWSPHSGFAKLRGEIDSFWQSVPSSLVYTAENLQIHAAERMAHQFILFHVICQQNILFLYRFAIPVSPDARPPREMPTQFLKEASRCAVEAASQISHLIRDAAGYPLTAPFAGYCAYEASLVQIWGMFSGDPQLEATSKENLKYNYRYMNKMKDYWGLHHRTVEHVKSIYHLFGDATSSGATSTTEPTGPGSGFVQLEAWYGKHPGKVTWTELADSSKLSRRESGSRGVMSHGSGLQGVEEFFASLLPPSKAALTRKVIRRRRHKKVGDIKISPPPQIYPPSNPHSSQQQHHQQHCPSEPCPPPLHHQNLAPCQTVPLAGFNTTTTTTNTTTNSTPGYMPDPPQQLYQSHSFNMSPFYPTNSLPSLDHQLPFKTCTGIDEIGDTHLNSGNYSTWQGQYMDPTFGNLGCEMDDGVNAVMQGHVPSSAWFVPFKVHPPQGGDVHSGLFMDPAGSDAGGGGGVGGGRPSSQQVMGNEGMTGGHGQTC